MDSDALMSNAVEGVTRGTSMPVVRTTWRRLTVISVMTSALVLAGVGWLWSRIEPTRPIHPFEEKVARAPLGMTINEADQYMGSKPDWVTVQSGVLVSPGLMLTAENPKSAKHGRPQEYMLRRWDRDGISGVLACDESGHVVGKWSWRPEAASAPSGD